MPDLLLYCLLLLAIVIGWLLGFLFALKRKQRISASGFYQQIQFLLNDQPEEAIDSFLKEIESNPATLETHFAVGGLLRRRGEVDQAIKVHENLLLRDDLSKNQQQQARLELARDYIAAGLLDRAEVRLNELVNEKSELAPQALEYLLDIYQQENEWHNALSAAEMLMTTAASKQQESLKISMSHFYCELAEIEIEKQRLHQAEHSLEKALAINPSAVRASLLISEISFKNADFDRAIGQLQNIVNQDPAFIPESLELLKKNYEASGNLESYREWLQQLLEKKPSIPVLLALVDEVLVADGDVAAGKLLSAYLKKHPSLKGLNRLIALHIEHSQGKSRENLSLLKALVEGLLERKPRYRCHHCGFAAKTLYWMCPGCRQWGCQQRIRGIEGD